MVPHTQDFSLFEEEFYLGLRTWGGDVSLGTVLSPSAGSGSGGT